MRRGCYPRRPPLPDLPDRSPGPRRRTPTPITAPISFASVFAFSSDCGPPIAHGALVTKTVYLSFWLQNQLQSPHLRRHACDIGLYGFSRFPYLPYHSPPKPPPRPKKCSNSSASAPPKRS